MKNVFYINLFLMITFCFVVGGSNPTNTTLAPAQTGLAVNSHCGQLISHYNPAVHGTAYNAPFVGVSCQAYNRKERRAQGQRKQSTMNQRVKIVTVDDEVTRISDKIYKSLGYEDEYKGNCFMNCINGIVLHISELIAMKTACEDAIIGSLQKIDKNIQETKSPKEVIKLLLEKNGYFHNLIDRLVWHKQEKGVTGSTIDNFFDKNCMFPLLSDALNSYVKSRIKEIVFEKYVSSYQNIGHGVKAYFRQKEDTFIDSSLCTYTRTNPEIHAIALKGHEHPIDKDSIMISSDNSYIKATDILGVNEGTTIIWDLLTGERCEDVNEESIVWIEKKVYEEDHKHHDQIEFVDREHYHISVCDSALSYSIKNRFCNRPQIPTLYLYKKPTLVSFVCQAILFKNRDNDAELDALLNSHVVQNELEGFPQKNLISAIRRAQEENRAKKDNCLF